MHSQSTLVPVQVPNEISHRHILSKILSQIVDVCSAGEIKLDILPAVDIPTLTETGMQISKTPWVVFADTAVQAIESAVLQGVSPDVALVQWQENTTRLLAMYRTHRRRMILVNGPATCCAPQAFVTALAARLDVTFKEPVSCAAQNLETGIVEKLIAIQTVAQSPVAKRLGGELEASSLLVPASDAVCDVVSAFETYQRGEKELASLRAQLCRVQEELEISETKRTRLKQQGNRVQETIAQLTEQKEAAQQESAYLLLQLANVQEEFEATFCQIRTEKSALEARISDLQKAAQDTARQEAERRDKLSANIAALKEELDVSGKENRLLVLQLANVQEELESYFLETQTLTQKQQESQAQITSLRAQLAGSTPKGQMVALQETIQELENNLKITQDIVKQRDHEIDISLQHQTCLQTELDQRTDELRNLLESTSWRATGPLRRLKDRLVSGENN